MAQNFCHKSLLYKYTVTVYTILYITLTTLSCDAKIYHIPLKRTNWMTDFSVNNVRRLKRSPDESIYGHSGEGYYIEMNIGTPPQKINVLVDTGSSNFAIAAAPSPEITTYFNRKDSSSYEEDGRKVNVPYTQGEWTGVLGEDAVMLNALPNVTVRPNIVFITQSSNFFINGSEWQGIVGLAYRIIARPDSSFIPYLDTLITQGNVDNVFAVRLCGTPASAIDDKMGGSMTIGGISKSLYTGKIFYTPIQKEWYYEVLITDIRVDNKTLNLDCKEYNFDKTIVDTGTTNVRFPKRVFNALINNIKPKVQTLESEFPSTFWSGDEVICWNDTTLPFTVFPTVSLSLYLSNQTVFYLHLPPQKYLRMVLDGSQVVGSCFKFGISSSESGTVLGAVLMEGYYVIFDRENKRIGFASTSCDAVYNVNSTDNIEGPVVVYANLTDCLFFKPVPDQTSMSIVAYVMAGVCALCVLPLIIMIIQWQYRRSCGKDGVENSDDSQLLER